MPFEYKQVTIIKANKFYLPLEVWKDISQDARTVIKNLFIQHIHNPYDCFFNQQNKRKCRLKEAAEDKGRKGISACYTCEKCEVVHKCISKSKNYICLERFNKEVNHKLKMILDEEGYKIKTDSRVTFPKLENPWKINTDKLDIDRAKDQIKLAETWNEEKNGVLIAPPRFVKVLLTAFVAAKLQTRILILVHKVELARQFYKDYLNFTTLDKSEIAVNPDIKDIDNLSVVICTYQQFISKNGKERLDYAKKKFGLIVVDEIHKAATPTFHKVINSFYARYRLGVTATPKRRDSKEFLNLFTFGQILAKGGTEQLSCDYVITETNWEGTNPTGNRGWEALWNKLASDKKRNNFIAKCVIHDFENGHRIMLPVKRHKQMELLYKLIKRKARKKGYNLNMCLYHGKLNKSYRKELQKDVSAGKYDVVIGSDQILSLGFNAPPISCIYINLHTYRTFEEDLYQEFSRIRTRYKKKNKPLIRIFKDITPACDKSMVEIERVMRKYKFNEITDEKETLSVHPRRSAKGLKILF